MQIVDNCDSQWSTAKFFFKVFNSMNMQWGTSLCLIVFLSLASWYPLLSPENDNISKSKTFFMFFFVKIVTQLLPNWSQIYTVFIHG